MPYLLLTLAALFWGGNYVVGHVLVQGVDPILMTEARWALTALLLGLLYRRQSSAVATCCGQTPRRWWCSPSVARSASRLRSILACKPPPRSTPPSICPPRRAWCC